MFIYESKGDAILAEESIAEQPSAAPEAMDEGDDPDEFDEEAVSPYSLALFQSAYTILVKEEVDKADKADKALEQIDQSQLLMDDEPLDRTVL